MKTQLTLSLLTALSASMCCIVPVLAIFGVTGSLATSFQWIEPFRPYFISTSALVLGFAWFQTFKEKKKADCCEPHGEKRSFFRSTMFLSIITIISLLLITFPTYSRFLFSENSIAIAEDQDKNKKMVIPVSGMTCTSCELHIESEVKKLPGVLFVKASYDKGQASVEFDEQKITSDKIIATINATGYKVEPSLSAMAGDQNGNCCVNGTCKNHESLLPTEENRNLKVVSGVEEIKSAFNKQDGKTKFVAILSSTCGWCLAGANSVQKAVIDRMKDKNISVIIIWTNMVKADDLGSAYKAASLFKDPAVTQFFDSENKFGDLVAQRLNPKGTKAWDIYMFFDQDAKWGQNLPRPFEYAHQLGSSSHPWVDASKYFCGANLTKRLNEITETL